MKNPFKAYQEYVKKTPRNSFDLSHMNNLTLPFGKLIPDLVLDVTAGDSASIDAAFAFNFLPMVFPIQTPVRINQYFFYVRYRNTWDNYEDFRYGNKSDLVHPYLDQSSEFFKTGSLADFMGIPTTLAVGERGCLSFEIENSPSALRRDFYDRYFDDRESGLIRGFSDSQIIPAVESGYYSLRRNVVYWCDLNNVLEGYPLISSIWQSPLGSAQLSTSPLASFRVNNISFPFSIEDGACWLSMRLISPVDDHLMLEGLYVAASNPRTGLFLSTFMPAYQISYNSSTGLLRFNISNSVPILNSLLENCENYDLWVILDGVSYDKWNDLDYYSCGGLLAPITASRPIDIADHPELNPFIGHGGADPVLKINALPFRAYEQIYNAYFRNERIDPFIKDGEVEYNDFGTTYADGADNTNYSLKNRNWELDMLTSCLKTPQQGTAPIVGVDGRRITFSDGENNYNFVYQTDSDGRLIADGSRFEEEDVPGTVRAGAVDLIANGFTIEQLREGNAMTLWIEKNIRRGLRYRDQLKAHTGIDLDYDELELPEFLGGFSHYVDVQSVTSNAGTAATVLGDIAGKATAFKKANHTISKFFREDGVVIGLITIVPQPVYSQLLPKFYLRNTALDYYNAEFSHLGMQPVPYKEVAPVQMYSAMQAGDDRTMETPFGYNRPNYDMVSMQDEVHGYMRTTDRDFVLMRVFGDVPELSSSFIEVDGSQLNDVFSVTDDNGHVARGQVGFKIFMKRPIPTVGEPRLE